MIRGDKNHLVDNIVHTGPIHFISASQICTVGLPRTGLHNKTEPYGGGGGGFTQCLPLLVNTSSQNFFSFSYPFFPSFLTFDRPQRDLRVLCETEKSKMCRGLRLLLKLETK